MTAKVLLRCRERTFSGLHSRAPSITMRRAIEGALARHAQIEAGAIKVNVRDGNKVSLEGKVDCWEEREAVENAAWSVAGVESVDDRLTIVR